MPPRTIREMPDGLGEEWGRIYIHKSEPQLFNYAVNLEKRVRS